MGVHLGKDGIRERQGEVVQGVSGRGLCNRVREVWSEVATWSGRVVRPALF